MPLLAAGYALALDQLTDATNGINKISIFTNIVETDKQTLNFSAAAGYDTYGTVNMTATDLVFNILAGHIVQAVGLYKDTTYVGNYVFPSPYSFTNAGTFTLTDLQIRLD